MLFWNAGGRGAPVDGTDGIAMTGPLGVEKLSQNFPLHRTAIRAVGNDVVETFHLAD